MSAPKEDVAFFRAEDGKLYKAIQAHNGAISQLSEVIVTENPLLDATLLSPEGGERQILATVLISEIFFMDSLFWVCGFIANFAVSGLFVPEAPGPILSTKLFFILLASLASVLITGYALLLLKRFRARRAGFAMFLTSVSLAGILYTAQTGSTLVARACVIQWIMSLGTVIAAFKSGKRVLPSLLQQPKSEADSDNGKCRLALPEIAAGLVVPAVMAWLVGFLSEPRLASALITLVPILPCAVYRYVWINHSVVASRQYRADEAVVAWCDFYSYPVASCVKSALALIPGK